MENINTFLEETNYDIHLYTYDTIMAFVDVVIPRTPLLAQMYGEIMYYGALDLYTDEYLIFCLNEYTMPYSYLIAEMLNRIAIKFINIQGIETIDTTTSSDAIFTKLTSEEKFLALTLLDDYNAYLSDEPIFVKYTDLVSVASYLVRLTMLGFYSEWFGYGSTRQEQPNQRVLEFIPLSWYQVSYPGRSLSYIQEVNEYYAVRNQSNV
jgi:hypothetical protein